MHVSKDSSLAPSLYCLLTPRQRALSEGFISFRTVSIHRWKGGGSMSTPVACYVRKNPGFARCAKHTGGLIIRNHMSLRTFLQSLFALAALVVTVNSTNRSAAAEGGQPQYYELRVYTTKSEAQQQLINDYWQKAAVPAFANPLIYGPRNHRTDS
jgi:hypothetical protein